MTLYNIYTEAARMIAQGEAYYSCNAIGAVDHNIHSIVKAKNLYARYFGTKFGSSICDIKIKNGIFLNISDFGSSDDKRSGFRRVIALLSMAKISKEKWFRKKHGN